MPLLRALADEFLLPSPMVTDAAGVVTEGVHVGFNGTLPNNDCFQGSQLCLYAFSDQNENIWPFQIFVCSFVTFPKR